MSEPHVLSLDISRSTGWAFSAGRGAPRFGTKQFLRGEHVKSVQTWHAYRVWLTEMIQIMSPTIVVFEAPVRTKKKPEIEWLLTGLCAITEELCYSLKLPCYAETPTDWRMHVLGFSRSDNIKGDVGFRLRQLGYQVADPDAADALGLLLYTLDCLMPDTADLLAGAVA